MSLAGVRSAQGDAFGELVALRYVVEMIYTESLQVIELDSTALDTSGEPVQVDDIVVHYDASKLYIQAKKNQTTHRAWSIADLSGELTKAWAQWHRESHARLLFISRNDFGDLGRLRDLATTQPTPEAFEHALTADLRNAAEAVVACDAGAASLSALYDFLRQLDVETIQLRRFRDELRGLLTHHVAHADAALAVLEPRLTALARRQTELATQAIEPHRLTRPELFGLLRSGGIEICPPRHVRDAAQALKGLAQIGRSWPRAIDGVRLSRSIVDALFDRIGNAPSGVLLSAGPGVGKTCILLDVLERLEQHDATIPVFLQLREFVGAKTPDEREALGLPRTLVQDIARLSESRHVVVLMDSLDVLSIAREHHALIFALSLIDRLRLIPNVTVVAACRTFDVQYDGHLAGRDWGEVLTVDQLNWDGDVVPLLQRFQVDPHSLPDETRELLINPRLLALFVEIGRTGTLPWPRSSQELTELYLERAVRALPDLGDAALTALGSAARWMLNHRRLDVPRVEMLVPDELLRRMLSAGILVQTHQRTLVFAHQTLLDVLAVSQARKEGATVAKMIRARAATPFVRPTVRAFLFSLRSESPDAFRQQVREVLDATDIAFHVRRLVAESLGELSPLDDDWPLIRHVFSKHSSLFAWFYQQATSVAWTRWLQQHWLPGVFAAQDGAWLTRFLDRLASTEGCFPEALDLWNRAFAFDWVDSRRLRWISTRLLDRHADWHASGLRAVFERLVGDTEDDHGALGPALARWITATNGHRDLLWQYISRRVNTDARSILDWGRYLECDNHTFGKESFLAEQLRESESFLELVLGDLERWSALFRSDYEADADLVQGFLNHTSHAQQHSQGMQHEDAGHRLFAALETALSDHGARRSSWWQANVRRLSCNPDAAMRYLAIKVFIADPEFHCADALTMLHDARLLHFQTLRWEVGQLLNCVMALTTADEQEVVQRLALAVPEEYEEPSTMPLWRLLAHRDLLVHIPSPYRLPEVQVLIERAAKLAGLYSQRPQIDSCGGWVRPPVTHEQMATLSDAGLRRLLAHYPTNSGGADFWERFNADGPVGGPSAVRQQVCEFASRWPYRCMAFLDESGTSLEHSYRTAMLEGIATHLRHRFGNLHSAQGWRAIEEPDGVDLARWLVQHVTRDLGAFVQGGEVGELVLGAAAVLISDGDIDDLTPLLARGMQAEDPTPGRVDKSDPLIIGLNSVRGRVAEAALTVANRRLTAQHSIPTALAQVLHLCASDPHPAVRAILLRLLPYAISRAPELGWELFERATNTMGAVAWAQTYNCLYYHYKRDTEIVARHLARLHATGDGSALGVWSRISALRTLAGLVVFETYLADLCALGSEEAWTGAADVFTANIASTHLRRTCERGLLAALGSDSANDSLLSEVSHLFRIRDQTSVQIICPIAVVEAYADALKARGSEQGRKVFGVGEWLAATAMEDPDYATTAIEAFLRGHVRLEAWDGSPYAQLLTTLFREAEERELSDQGQLLARVIAVQDALLSFDMTSLDGWLRAAERP